jgi:hypothetical protein
VGQTASGIPTVHLPAGNVTQAPYNENFWMPIIPAAHPNSNSNFGDDFDTSGMDTGAANNDIFAFSADQLGSGGYEAGDLSMNTFNSGFGTGSMSQAGSSAS